MECNPKYKLVCKAYRIVALVALAFAAVVAVFADRNVEVVDSASFFGALNGMNVLTVVLFAFFIYLFGKALEIRRRRIVTLALIGAVLFAAMVMVGFNVHRFDAYANVALNPYYIVLNMIIFAGYAILFYVVLAFLFSWCIDPEKKLRPGREYKWFGANARSFVLVVAILILCWLPYYITFYPGLMSSDTYDQLQQAMGVYGYYNHHPVLHTWLMGALVKTGWGIFGTMAGGVAFFTFCQMCFLAAIYAFVICYMAKRGISFVIRSLSMLFFALFPMFGLYGVIMWKDIWLAAFLLLYVIFVLEIVFNSENFFASKFRIITLILVLLGMFFFKSVGLYIFLITLPFIIFVARKYWKQLCLVAAISVCVFFVVTGPMFEAAGIGKGSSAEMLSIPAQQIARIVKYEGDNLNESEKETLGEILPYTELPELYNPVLSDPVKWSIDMERYNADKGKYVKIWANMVRMYPGKALLATLANSVGYWYPDTSNGPAYVQRYYDFYDVAESLFPSDEYMDPYWGTYQVSDASRNNAKALDYTVVEALRKAPVIAQLYSPGFYYWVFLICVLLCILKKRYKMLVPLLVIFVVFLTNIASPVSGEFRYAWPAIICAPVIIAFTLQDDIKLTKNMLMKEKDE